jgi:hypothetical protein
MFIHKLYAPEDMGGGAGGGAGASDAPAGGDAGASDAGPSMEDTARSAYRELMSDTSDDTDAGNDTGSTETTEQQPHHKNQPRENGRFARNGQQQASTQENTEQQQQQRSGQPAPGEQPQQRTHDAFPNTWQKDLEQDWGNIPERVRQQIHKRESDFHNGLTQYKEAAGFGVSLAREMQPYREIMQRMNVTPQAVVRDVMGSLKTLATGSEESKAHEFLKLAQQYGINWDTLSTLRQRAPQGADPNLQPVIQRMQQLETRITQADQEREQQLRERDEAAVQSFINDPKNEHAKAVAKQMGALLQSGEASTLQEAYEKAVWLDPVVRAKLLEKQEADRKRQEAEQVAAAKKAAAANVTRRGTPPSPQKPKTMEDSARAVYRRLIPSG